MIFNVAFICCRRASSDILSKDDRWKLRRVRSVWLPRGGVQEEWSASVCDQSALQSVGPLERPINRENDPVVFWWPV